MIIIVNFIYDTVKVWPGLIDEIAVEFSAEVKVIDELKSDLSVAKQRFRRKFWKII